MIRTVHPHILYDGPEIAQLSENQWQCIQQPPCLFLPWQVPLRFSPSSSAVSLVIPVTSLSAPSWQSRGWPGRKAARCPRGRLLDALRCCWRLSQLLQAAPGSPCLSFPTCNQDITAELQCKMLWDCKWELIVHPTGVGNELLPWGSPVPSA